MLLCFLINFQKLFSIILKCVYAGMPGCECVDISADVQRGQRHQITVNI